LEILYWWTTSNLIILLQNVTTIFDTS
jgi:hypothetical protein